MPYTIGQLASVAGISVRALRFYDQVDLLKPAYLGDNGYRYYEEEQLLMLQQILFFRELGFTLSKIREVLGRGDFDKISALYAHKKILKKEIGRMLELIKTIDKTVTHLQGEIAMKEEEIYFGFGQEKQKEYEKEIAIRFGKEGMMGVKESRKNTRNWKKSDWEISGSEFASICAELREMLHQSFREDSEAVQKIIYRHHQWLRRFWTPTKESYTGYADLVIESELRTPYEKVHPQLPEFIAGAIKIYAQTSLL